MAVTKKDQQKIKSQIFNTKRLTQTYKNKIEQQFDVDQRYLTTKMY